MSQSHIYKCILKALDSRYNLDLKEEHLFERHDANVEWSHNCMVTQDWDELNEFIYANELTVSIADEKKPLYFDPHAKWSCLFLPKIKIRWSSRIKQIKLGNTIFNMLEGRWDAKGTVFTITDTDGIAVKIYPYHGTTATDQNNISSVPAAASPLALPLTLTLTSAPSLPLPPLTTCLIPFKNYTFTQMINDNDTLPTLSIADEKLECVYAAMHVNVSFNRQGLYINRKYREKTEYLNPADLPSDYRIIEPAAIELKSLKIKLT